MAKKKFADGGTVQSLGNSFGFGGLKPSHGAVGFGGTAETGYITPFDMPPPNLGGGGGGGGARGGLDTINQGSATVSSALDQIGTAIGGGGGSGGFANQLKKGGAVKGAMKSKISTAQTSGKKKNSCW